ncbi:MAG TPA: GatB/YqeY domain-containing protein, partial [Candidatus Entotheonella sp.]
MDSLQEGTMASTMLDQILDDIKTAMKAQDKEKLMALRLLHSEIKNVGINERRDPTDEDTLNVISRLIKQRQEAIEQFKQGGRDDLVAKDALQLEVYRSYQP